jgi:hypothetical protein
MWNNYGTADASTRSAAIKKMGGLAKCTTAALVAEKAAIKMDSGTIVLMSNWYPQDFDIKGTTFVPT